MSRTLYGHHIETIKGEDYILHKDYTELQNKYYKQKEVLDKIKEYAEKYKIIGVIAPEENEYMKHILELLEEIE